MRFAHSQTYLAAFAKPWYVTLGFLQAGARERGFRLVGYWPKGHPNAPKFPPGVGLGRPYSHLVAGRMDGPDRDLELPSEVAWVIALPVDSSR